MKPNSSFASMAYGFVGAGVFFVLTKAGPVVAQVAAAIPYVRLQPTTPGTQESGNSNISGTARAGQFIGSGGGLTNVNATLLDGIDSTAFLQAVPNPLSLTGTDTGSIIYAKNNSTTAGSAGIVGEGGNATAGTGVKGVAVSQVGRGVSGFATAASGSAYGGYFDNKTDGGYGVYAASDGLYGIYARARGTNLDGVAGYFLSDAHRGPAIVGVATSGFSTAHGGEFTASGGDGVRARSSGIIGVRGTTTAGGALISYGGYFSAENSTNGNGVGGVATSLTGAVSGVVGETYSIEGRGVNGISYSNTGTTFGGRFVNLSTNGYGVYARTEGPYGVFGETLATSGTSYGGRFESPSSAGRGVYGLGSASGPADVPYGVRGQASTGTNGFALYAVGDSGATGVKAFRIDHPQDPENKYLLHYSSESPFPQNFYNGNVTTDANGYAWVTLPDYFAEINTNFKYVLTVVDNADSAGFVMAKVSKKIVGNRFQIRTSVPHAEVSWEVKADRNDLRVRMRRPVDVQDKVGVEKGKYQHPEYYGKPASMGMDYDPARSVRGERLSTRP